MQSVLSDYTLAQIRASKQFRNLEKVGLRLVSTNRQLENGTLSFEGSVKVGKSVLNPSYQVTAVGMVISNKHSARFVNADSNIGMYRKGLDAVTELLTKQIVKQIQTAA